MSDAVACMIDDWGGIQAAARQGLWWAFPFQFAFFRWASLTRLSAVGNCRRGCMYCNCNNNTTVLATLCAYVSSILALWCIFCPRE